MTIIGAGAIGGTIGAHLIRAGNDVVLCDADKAHVDAINRDGLVIEGPVENFTVSARAITPEELPNTLEHVAIAVKSHHTGVAAEVLRQRLDRQGYLVSFQNGFTADTLAGVVGWERLIVGFVNFGADVVAPGRILQGNVGAFRVGEPRGGVITERVQLLAETLPYAEATENIMGYLWAKEAYGAMLYAGAVSDLSIADSLEDPRWQPLMLAIAREVLAQAPIEPQPFDGFDPKDLEASLARMVTFNRTSAKSHSGIYRDLMVRRRKTEVDDLLRDLKGPLTTYVGELIRAIERGERTCEVANLELLAAYERTERLGRQLDAVVRLIPAPARASTGPLHGIPVAVKDLVDVEGLPRGNGNPHDMEGPPATSDAPVVAALRRLGADVFATTSLLEYAAGALHPQVPETRNPYDPHRTAGGSSGGSAALVAVGACPLALGTDTGGSIRIPAAYCGVVGLKPTFGALPSEGVQPLAPSLDHVGLLGRDVEITARAFAALTGGELAPARLTSRLGVVEQQFTDPVLEPEMAAGLRSALHKLAGAGVPMREVDDAPLAAIRELFDEILLWELWQVHGATARRDPAHYGPETLRLLQTGATITESAYHSALRRRDELLPDAATIYHEVDVVLTPVVPFAAPATTPPIDTPEGAAEGRFSGVFNLTGDPALSLPCGWSGAGLPIAIQLSAPRGADAELLAAAARIAEILDVPRHEPAVR
ncbi:MAG: amidase family protein [Candidatus Dormiibacterota bacterium]